MFIMMMVYNLLACLALLWLVGRNPRYMMQDYPPEITANIPPQTAEEKREVSATGCLSSLFWLVFLLLPGCFLFFLGRSASWSCG